MDLSALFSGRMIRAVVTAFHLRERWPDLLKSRSFENYFRGDPGNSWSQQKQFEALRSFGEALINGQLLEIPESLMPRTEAKRFLGAVLVDCAHRWDVAVAELRSAPSNLVDVGGIVAAFLRVAVFDTALRLGALDALNGRVSLRGSLSLRACMTRRQLTRSSLVQLLKRHHSNNGEVSQIDKWLHNAHIPDLETIGELAAVLADEADGNSDAYVFELHLHFGTIKLLRAAKAFLGDDTVEELVSHWWDFRRRIACALLDTAAVRAAAVDLFAAGLAAEASRPLVDRLAEGLSEKWTFIAAAIQRGDALHAALREGQIAAFATSPELAAAERNAEQLFRERNFARLKTELFLLSRAHRENADVRLLYASYLSRLKCWPEAEAELRESMRLAPRGESQRVELVTFYWQQNRNAEAIDVAKHALRELCGPCVALRHQLAVLYLEEKRPTEAIEQLEAIQRAQPQSVRALDLLATAELLAGRRTKAERHALAAFRLGYAWTYVRLSPKEGWTLSSI